MILAINHNSASSSELITEGFYFNKNVTRIGENSAGAFHYGCPGIIWLKNISVVVYTPTCRDYFLEDIHLEVKGEEVNIHSTDVSAFNNLLRDIKRQKQEEFNKPLNWKDLLK